MNLFVSPPLSFLFYPFIGLNKKELFTNEAKKFLKSNNFSCCLSNHSTTIYKSGKLDYILTPAGLEKISEQIMKKNLMGSDHYPLLSKIKISDGLL